MSKDPEDHGIEPPSIGEAVERYRRQRAEIYRLAPREAVANTRGAKAVARDHISRVIYELLQNAEDAAASEVRIEIHAASMTFLFGDNGVGVAARAVESLAGLFLSSKGAGIGRKGVGFKSVYSVSDRPMVVSGQDAIMFDPELARQWMVEHEFDTSYVPYQWIPFHQSRAAVERAHELLVPLSRCRTAVMLQLRNDDALKSLSDDLSTFDARSLLAFRNIERLSVRAADGTEFVVAVSGDRGRSGVCTLTDSRHAMSRWRLEWKSVEAPGDVLASLDEDERERARISQVMVGAEVDAQDVPIVPKAAPNLFVYYPTRHLSPSKLLTHADFVVSSDRTQISIPAEHSYNAWLATCVADTTVTFCNGLVERGLDRVALHTLAADARRKDRQETSLRGAVVDAARRDLNVNVMDGSRVSPDKCHVIDGRHVDLFSSVAPHTALAQSLPRDDVLNDKAATACLRELGAHGLSAVELLDWVSAMLKTRPAPDTWALALWRWLCATDQSIATEQKATWKARIEGTPFLPGESAWVSPQDAQFAPFLLAVLGHRADGVCQIHPCHSVVLSALSTADDRQSLIEFLAKHGAQQDPVSAQIVALDLATKRHWAELDASNPPERFLQAIEAWDLLSVPRPSALLLKCPVPTRRGDNRGWQPAWMGHLTGGEGTKHMRSIYRDNTDVAWIDRHRLEKLGIDQKVIEWLGCPTRPVVVAYLDDASRTNEDRRVRTLFMQLGVSHTQLQPTSAPKRLQNISTHSLDPTSPRF